jgi:hypothetical protein
MSVARTKETVVSDGSRIGGGVLTPYRIPLTGDRSETNLLSGKGPFSNLFSF